MEEEFVENASHSEPTEPQEPVEPTDPTEPSEPVEPQEPSEPDEEFDVIKWNKEEVKIPASKRKDYLQKGYDYDRQRERAEKSHAALQRSAKIAGFDNVDEYLEAIDRYEEEQRIKEIQESYGKASEANPQIPEEVARELLQLREERSSLHTERQMAQLKDTFSELEKNYPDFKDHAEAVFAHMQEIGVSNPTYKAFETAYKAVTYEARIESLRKQTEQEILANITERDGKRVLSSGDKPADVKIDISSMSSEEFRKFSAEARERAARGERVQF